MELDHANQFPSLPSLESGLTKYLVCAALGHVVADGFHGTPALEGGRIVRRKRLRHDLNCLVFKLMSMYERLRGDNTTGGSILVIHARSMNQWAESAGIQIGGNYRCWAAHQFRQLVCDFVSIHDLFVTPTITKLRIRILYGMPMILGRCADGVMEAPEGSNQPSPIWPR